MCPWRRPRPSQRPPGDRVLPPSSSCGSRSHPGSRADPRRFASWSHRRFSGVQGRASRWTLIAHADGEASIHRSLQGPTGSGLGRATGTRSKSHRPSMKPRTRPRSMAHNPDPHEVPAATRPSAPDTTLASEPDLRMPASERVQVRPSEDVQAAVDGSLAVDPTWLAPTATQPPAVAATSRMPPQSGCSSVSKHGPTSCRRCRRLASR